MQRPIRLARALTSAFAVLLAAASLALVTPTSAAATPVPDAITSVTTDKTSYGYNERIKLTFEWAVPDSTAAGDTFSLALPDELRAVSLAKFSLYAPDGAVVASAEWNGKSVDFALTDYVDTHDGVGGSGFLTVQWDHNFTPETSQPIMLEFDGVAIEVTIGDKPMPSQPCTENCPPPSPTPTSRSLAKSGGWTDGSYEGTREESGNINWSIRLPGNETGFAGPLTTIDTPGVGSVIECGTIALTTQSSLAGSAVRTPVDVSRYTVDCTPSGFTIVLDAVAPSEFITITYKGTITDQRSGSYGNHVEIAVAGTTTIKDTVMKRTDAGGVGGGVQSVSVGDLVWLDTDRDGIQDAGENGIAGVTLRLTGPDGTPVTRADGTIVHTTVTDSAGRYGFAGLPVLPAGGYYTVSIDAAASSEALTDLVPTLPQRGTADEDSSTRTAESGDLTTNGAQDLTLDFGFISTELPTLPLPEPENPRPVSLASTGAGGSTPLPPTIAVLGLGVLLTAWARHRVQARARVTQR